MDEHDHERSSEYEVGLKQSFIAQHYLVGGDFGAENDHHSHHYTVEIALRGPKLDHHGYLFDIAALKERTQELVGYFSDRTLNDLTEFDGLNPSLEHFARIFGDKLTADRPWAGIRSLTITLWEDDCAWAAHTRPVQ